MTYERYQNGTAAPQNGTPSSREIQSDVVQIREEMSKTLHEITEKLAPKEMVSQAMSAITNGGGARFLKNLSSAIERNPVPAALIAGGIGYLMYEELKGGKADRPTRTGEFPEAFEGARSRELQSGHDGAEMFASNARARAAQLADRARDGARAISQRASNAASQAASTTREAAHKGQELLREQPLVVAGLGLALGAAIAGTAPLTRREEQLIGEPASELIGEIEQRANQIKDRVEEGVRSVGEAAQQALTAPGDPQQHRGEHGPPGGPA
jgi:hypothetical protein